MPRKKSLLWVVLLLAVCSCQKPSTPERTGLIEKASGFARGADISWCTEMEADGYKFRDANGQEKDIFVLMKELGMTAVNWNTVTYYGSAGQLEDQGYYESIYPASEENQRNYLLELANEIKKSSSVIGYVYRDPVTVKLSTWSYTYYGTSGSISNYDNGTINQNAALFDFNGNRLAAWDAFKYNN